MFFVGWWVGLSWSVSRLDEKKEVCYNDASHLRIQIQKGLVNFLVFDNF